MITVPASHGDSIKYKGQVQGSALEGGASGRSTTQPCKGARGTAPVEKT